MLDIKLLRQNREHIERKLRAKQSDTDVARVISLDERLRELKAEVEQLKSKRNEISRTVGERKRLGEEAGVLLTEVGALGDRVDVLDKELRGVEEEYEQALSALVNVPMDEVFESLDPKDNVLLREWGKKPEFPFKPKHHLELNESLHLFDFKRSAKLSGTGWAIYRGLGARLEWALLQYMMDFHVKRGWMPFLLPLCVRPEIMYGVGQLPKFEHQLYKVDDPHHPLYLIPTSEAALTGLHFDEILLEEELPLRYTAYTPCFRREAGAAGEKERGLIRMHQFNKVEMYAVTTPEQSEAMFLEMVAGAEELVKGLGLHFRSMALATGDLAVPAAKTIDVEVWLPGQNRYYEVSSVSTCTDYQARRSRIRFRKGGQKPEFVHTLNGSGLATSRLMVALLESNQLEDGSVVIPPILRPYLGGMEKIDAVGVA